MKETLAKGLVFVTSVAVVIYVLTCFNITDPLPALVLSLGVNVISSPIYVGLVEFLYNLKNISLFWKTRYKYRNDEVRLSISYLFRIQAKGKYLLVKNGTGSYFQLVGGAYKTLPSSERVFKKFKVKPDRRFETSHGIAKNDLRFTLPGRYVLNIIKWFNSREDRETSQWREFCEELLTTDIIDKHLFRYIDYKYAMTLQTPLKKAKKLDCQEILIYEIFDLIPNDEQLKYLETLVDKGSSANYKWADIGLIKTLGFNERTKEIEYEIGAHTKWAILEKWTDD